MYWKDELDCLYHKKNYGKMVWKMLEGNQVELLLRNNKRKTGKVLKVLNSKDGVRLFFQESSVIHKRKNVVLLSSNDIK
jgi:hypothetical protein